MRKISQIEQAIKENFDWEDFQNTPLDGPSWDSQCGDLIENFISALNKELPKGTAPTKERKQALDSLLVLFSNRINDEKQNIG